MGILSTLSDFLIKFIPDGIGNLFKTIRKQQRKNRKKYKGSWGNEGVINAPVPEIIIELELNVKSKDKEVNGILHIRKTNGEFEENYISLNGYTKWNYAIVSMTNIKKDGVLIDYGTVRLKIEKKNLKWNLIKSDSMFFPKEILLHRTLSSTPV